MSLFLCTVLRSALISIFFFTHGCPLFPAPFTEEAVFSPLYIFPFFVKDKVPLSGWIYFWAFYLVLLIYISGFFASMILSWLLWLCSIVWSKEGWFLQPLFFFSPFLSNALANQGLLCFHTTCNTFHSSSVKNTIGNLIGILDVTNKTYCTKEDAYKYIVY